MESSTKNMRGLHEIRTYSGRVDQLSHPHKVYLKLACLELEILRRGKEKESALFRMRDIDERFTEIEAEKAALLQKVDARRAAGQTVSSGSPRGPTSVEAALLQKADARRAAGRTVPSGSPRGPTSAGIRIRY